MEIIRELARRLPCIAGINLYGKGWICRRLLVAILDADMKVFRLNVPDSDHRTGGP